MSDNAIGSIFIGMTAGYGLLKSHMDKGAKSIDAITGAASKADGRLGRMAQPKGKGGGFLGDVAGVAARLGVVGAVIGGIRAAGNFFVDGIKGASDLNEAINLVDVTLGAAAPSAKALAEEMAKNYGIAKVEILDAAGSLGTLGKNLGGLKGNDLIGFTDQFTRMAADISSVKNIDIKESVSALRIGLSGEQSDVLKQLGAVTTEAALKQYALAHGLKMTNGVLSEENKLAARAGILTEKLAFAKGDLANTAGGAANQFRKAGGGLQNFATAIGTAMLPAVMAGTTAFNELLASIVETFEANRPMIEGWSAAIADTFGLVGVVMRNFGSVLEIGKLKAVEFGANFLAVIETIPANLAIVAEYIANNWYALIVDGLNATMTAFSNFSKNLGELGYAIVEFLKDPTGGFHFTWTKLSDGFKATAEALPDLIAPELISVQDKIDSITGEMAGREVKRAESLAAGKPAAKQAEAVASAAAAPGEKFAKLAEEGSKEAYSAVIKHRFGDRSGGDSTKKIAKNSDRQVELLEKLADAASMNNTALAPHINGFAI